MKLSSANGSLISPGLLGRILFVLAALVSLYLAIISLTQTSLLGCQDDSGCYSVLETRWAFLFGLPASFPAIAVYLVAVLAAGAFEAREQRTWLGLAGEVTILLITVAAVWYLSLQFVALGEFCAWCCLTHILALGGVLCLMWSRRMQPMPDETQEDWAEAAVLRRQGLMSGARWLAITTGLFILGAGPFIGTKDRYLHTAVAKHRVEIIPVAATANGMGPVVSFQDGKIQFSTAELPRIGKSNARELAVALTDYTCDYCRLYHVTLQEVVRSRGENFAVLLLPATRDDNSVMVQLVMLCLYRADPEKHHTLHTQLLSGTHPHHAEAVRQSARTLLGEAAWQQAEQDHSGWAAAQLKLTQELREANHLVAGSTRLPQLMAGTGLLVGYYEDSIKVNSFVESHLHPEEPNPGQIVRQMAGLDPVLVAKLVPQQPFVDLGSVEPGAEVPCTVEFSNTGKGWLKVGFVTLDQGCELVSLPDRDIPQGGKAQIQLKIAVPETGSTFQRRIQIHSNAESVGSIVVQGLVNQPEQQARALTP